MEQNNVKRLKFAGNIEDFLYTRKDYEFAYVVLNTINIYHFIMVYGPNGVGKSHLVKGLISNYKSENPDKVVGETTAEKLTMDIVNAIRSKNYDIIKPYENTDVLVVDNGFTLCGKAQTQREFLEIADRIINRGGSVIIISEDLNILPPYSLLPRYIDDDKACCIFVDMPYPTIELKEAFIYDY